MKRLFILLGLLIVGSGARLDGQVNPNGRIQSQGWLALGPFTNPFGCTGIDAYFLTLHLAPSSIHTMAPDEGHTVEYDPALASTQRYSGPRSGGKPVWRPFDDGTADEDLNFEADAARVGGETEAGVTYAVSYFEYLGAGPIAVDLCVQLLVDPDLDAVLVPSWGSGSTAGAGAAPSASRRTAFTSPKRIPDEDERPGYRLPLPPGRYQVTLHFAELWFHRHGSRAFDVFVEGMRFLNGFEPLQAGFAVPQEHEITVEVTDGLLEVELAHRVENPIVSAVEVKRAE